MKKKILGISLLVVLFLIVLIFILIPKNKTIELSKEYYKEEKGNLVEITKKELPKGKNYLLFTYNNYCNFPIPCDEVFQTFAEEEKIDILAMPFAEFKKTTLYEKVKYAPSILVVNNNKVIAYLDANSDKHLDLYQDEKKFKKWIEQYIIIK